jgi:hypothetical protein
VVWAAIAGGERLNRRQRIVLIAATLLFLSSELVPPWQYEYSYLTFTFTCPARYGLITQPPAVPNYGELQRRCSTSDPIESVKTRKDLERLNLQRVILVLIALGLFLGLSDRQTKLLMIIGAIALSVGLLLLIGYIALLYFTYV